jgi:Flp pilus assembly protein TadB
MASQARASAAVLVAAPAVFAIVLAAVDPRLATFLLTHPGGAACVGVGLLLDGTGLWWMQRIVDGGAR